MLERGICHLAAACLAATGLISMPSLLEARSVNGPIEGRITLGQGTFAHAPANYVVGEFFLDGTANAYSLGGDITADGKWQAETSGHAAYKTRMVVARPSDAAKFNGTVVVEWLNVSSGTDGAPDWNYLHRELVREGYAYVGVSSQKVGLEGGKMAMPGVLPVKQADPERYGSLAHPGDAYSYDIFSQAGLAIRDRKSGLLGSLKLDRILAMGESQSAAFLTTYVNTIDPQERVFDGFLIHSRFRGAAPIDGDFLSSMQARESSAAAKSVQIRADVRVPVLMFITETDLMAPMVGFLPARQGDSARIRTWEVAGTAHADTYTVVGSTIDSGSATSAQLARAFIPTAEIMGLSLGKPMNAAPQHHYVMEAALSALNSWVATGKAPPSAPTLSVADGAPPTLIVDRFGNSVGGVRSPWMDVPTAIFSGLGQSGPGFAMLFGTTFAFDESQLAELYPDGKRDYLAKFEASLRSAIEAGFILPADEIEIRNLAAEMYPGE
ncbi:hypothetical protein SAMN06295912_13117 [Sphingomonas laterariae]|uniref:Alpha/beta hydrolase domain-containing protein n=2 Tax=Edaphosphingomonas laterariae TaxID=861865 RepID=A0A239J7B7_9SPHN|nr:hypothetical protein SAMN06295912_13117 [Sphingomonas laterariae]